MEKELDVAGYYWDGTTAWIIYEDERGKTFFVKKEDV